MKKATRNYIVWMLQQKRKKRSANIKSQLEKAIADLKSLDPVALWCPRMQTDGLRYSEADGKTYLTRFTDLSGNGNHALQSTDTAQAYLQDSKAVFSGEQWYDAGYAMLSGIQSTNISTHIKNAIPEETRYILSQYADNVAGRWGVGFDKVAPYDKIRMFADGFVPTSATTQAIDKSNIISLQYNAVAGNVTTTLNSDSADVMAGNSFLDMPTHIGGTDRVTNRNAKGEVCAIVSYNKALTTHEQAVVNQCLAILGA